MATPAQCFYCFECLSASFENREPPSLSRVTALWEEYEKSLLIEDESGFEGSDGPAQEEQSAVEDAEDEEDEQSPDEDEDQEDDEGQEESPAINTNSSNTATTSNQVSRPVIPRISRLQASTPSSQSSGSSTPSNASSSISARSSNSALATPASSTTSIPKTLTDTLLRRARSPSSVSSRLPQNASYPLFVTWNTHSRHSPQHKSLRGCIGTFDPLPLAMGLQTYALTSAFEDTRFSPIPQSLMPALSCNITLLADFETCAHPLDWTIGVHGLRVSFAHHGRRYGATYLPDVAVEQGWDKEETLESLMRKAGWEGGGGGAGSVARRLLRAGRGGTDGNNHHRQGGGAPLKPWEEVGSFTTVRYTGLKASATNAEWSEWRAWVEERHGRGLLA